MNIVPKFIRRKIEHRPSLLGIVDNIGWLFIDKILRMGVGVLVGAWVARYLGTEKFGLFNFATAFVGLFGAVAGLGLQGIVVRDIVRNPGVQEDTLGTAAALQFVGGLVAYILILVTIFWLRSEDAMAKALVAIIGSMMLFKSSEVAMYWFESQVLSKYTVWAQNGCFLVFAAVKVLLILNGAPLIAFGWAALAEGLLVALMMLMMLRLRGPQLRQLRGSLTRAKELMIDSWPLMLSGITVMIYMKIDQIMLGEMIGDDAVGIYSAALRISEVWYFVPMAIVATVFPTILAAKKRDEDEYYRRLQQLLDIMVWLSLGVALPMTFLATPIINVMYGSAFHGAGAILAVHIWAAVFVFLGVASSRWFILENKQILSLQRSVMGAIINVILNFLLIPRYGALGAAWATVISQFGVNVLYDAMQEVTRRMFRMKIKAFNPMRIKQLMWAK